MRARAVLVYLSLAVSFGLALSACGGSNSSSKAPPARNAVSGVGELVQGGTFDVAIAGDPGALDPATNTSSEATGMYPFLYDTLVTPNADNEIVSNLATEWKVSPRLVTFTIRRDVTCADGSPVTPTVIARNLDFLKNPKVQYPALGTLGYTVTADDAAGIVTIRFEQPAAFVLQSMQFAPIVCGKGLDNRDALARGSSGSGPYELTEVVPNDHYTLSLRDGYNWGPDGARTSERGMPAKVTFSVVPNATTSTNLLLRGELDAAVIGGSEVNRLRASDLQEARSATGVTQATFNQTAGHVTADKRVREALEMATDRAGMAKVIDGRIATSLVPAATDPCPNGDIAEALPSYDPTGASKRLDEAGWTMGADGTRAKGGKPLELTLLGVSMGDPSFDAAAELVAESWRSLGIDVKSRILAPNAAVQVLGQGAWDAIPMYALSVPAPSQLVPFLTGPPPPEGANASGIDNVDYERLTEQAAATADTEAACKLWNQADLALINGVDFLPGLSYDTVWFVSDQVSLEITDAGIAPTSVRMHRG